MSEKKGGKVSPLTNVERGAIKEAQKKIEEAHAKGKLTREESAKLDEEISLLIQLAKWLGRLIKSQRN